MSRDESDVRLPEGWHRMPGWKRWGFLGVLALYWLLWLVQHLAWGRPFLLQVLWQGLRPTEELPWVLLGVGLELFLVVGFPLWYTAVMRRLPDVRPEAKGLRLQWPLPHRERVVAWAEIRKVEPTLAFSWVDLSAGGVWLHLYDGSRVPVSYGLRDGVQLVDLLEARLPTPTR